MNILFILSIVVQALTATVSAQAEQTCYSTTECPSEYICTTERGECNTPPNCTAGSFCPAICSGRCIREDNPFTVSIALKLEEIYFSKQCEACNEYVWVKLREGIGNALPADAELQLVLEEYSLTTRLFTPVTITIKTLLNAKQQIDAHFFTLPASSEHETFPVYQYLKLSTVYKGEQFVWVLRVIKESATSSTIIEASTTNPTQAEFLALLKPPPVPVTSTPVTFRDVEPNSLLATATSYLTSRGIISGYPDGTFKPYNIVNRAEAAKFLLNSRYGKVSAKMQKIFPDVAEDTWYAPFVTFAYKQGIINGYPDGSFKPAQTVNTVEFLKMLSNTFTIKQNTEYPYIDVTTDDWFSAYAGMAHTYRLFPKRPTYVLYPTMLLTREEVAIAMYTMLTSEAAAN